MSNLIELKELANEIGCCPLTVNQYLCRSEFAHIKRKRIDKMVHFLNITDEDIKKLKNLFEKRNVRRLYKHYE